MSNPSRTSRRVLLAGAAIALAGSARAQPSDDPAQLLALMSKIKQPTDSAAEPWPPMKAGRGL